MVTEDRRPGEPVISKSAAPSSRIRKIGHLACPSHLQKCGWQKACCLLLGVLVLIPSRFLGFAAQSISTSYEVDGFCWPHKIAASCITPDGKRLLLAIPRPKGRADAAYVAATLDVLDTKTGDLIRELHLPNGSGALRAIGISPDGKYAVVTHTVAQFTRPTVHLSLRWMNANALTILDLVRLEVFGSVLLDDFGKGAANPWALAWSGDGSLLVVTHAGTHELSIIPFAPLIEKISYLPAPIDLADPAQTANLTGEALATASYLPFFPSPRQRVKLPKADIGPRGLTIIGNTAYVTNYFSDTVTVLDVRDPQHTMRSVPLPSQREMTLARKGEMYFNDATICFQGWQSCASCHPDDGRPDGFNWDLLNDGIGNPKNTKSLLLAHQTPPAMTLGVRETAETAVRSGIEHILCTKQPESVALAIDSYLKSLKPAPSPYLENGKLSALAEQGKAAFARAGCATCHRPGLFTDRHAYNVDTHNSHDKPGDKFDTPTLIEVWRTAPYLHDGSAVTIRDVITRRNPKDQHGNTSILTSDEIDALCAYVLSL